MPRHARAVDPRSRAIRLATVGAVWVAGLAVGFDGMLAATARYGCGRSETGLACRETGSVMGFAVVIVVIAVVTVVTMLTHDRPVRRVLVVGGVGLGALLLCFLASRSLLSTV